MGQPLFKADTLLFDKLSTICQRSLLLAGLWAKSGVMPPVVFAVFIIALVWPFQRRLQAVLPQVIAVLVTAATALLVVGVGGWLVVGVLAGSPNG